MQDTLSALSHKVDTVTTEVLAIRAAVGAGEGGAGGAVVGVAAYRPILGDALVGGGHTSSDARVRDNTSSDARVRDTFRPHALARGGVRVQGEGVVVEGGADDNSEFATGNSQFVTADAARGKEVVGLEGGLEGQHADEKLKVSTRMQVCVCADVC
jgi:hypothetical protein